MSITLGLSPILLDWFAQLDGIGSEFDAAQVNELQSQTFVDALRFPILVAPHEHQMLLR